MQSRGRWWICLEFKHSHTIEPQSPSKAALNHTHWHAAKHGHLHSGTSPQSQPPPAPALHPTAVSHRSCSHFPRVPLLPGSAEPSTVLTFLSPQYHNTAATPSPPPTPPYLDMVHAEPNAALACARRALQREQRGVSGQKQRAGAALWDQADLQAHTRAHTHVFTGVHTHLPEHTYASKHTHTHTHTHTCTQAGM